MQTESSLNILSAYLGIVRDVNNAQSWFVDMRVPIEEIFSHIRKRIALLLRAVRVYSLHDTS